MNNQTSKPAMPAQFHANVPQLLADAGFSAQAAQAALDLDSTMFQWKSTMMRGELPTRMMQELDVDLDLTQFRFLTAITRIQNGIARDCTAPATIGLVAEELNVDPSRASRLAADLIGQGYLRREAAQDDGRKSILVLTDHAQQVFAKFRDLKWRKFMAILSDWQDSEITEFARLFEKYLSSTDREFERRP